MNCFRMLYSPKSAFERLSVKSMWAWDFLMISAILIVVTYLSMPIVERTQELMLGQMQGMIEKLPPETQKAMQDQLAKQQSSSIVSVLVGAPIGYLISSLLWAVLLYAGVCIFKGQSSFEKILALTVAAYLPMAIGNYVNSVICILVIGVDNITNIWQTSYIGLNALFDSDKIGVFMYAVLGNVTPFYAWFIALLSLGVSHLSGISRGKAFGTAITIWLLATLFTGGVAVASNFLTSMQFGG